MKTEQIIELLKSAKEFKEVIDLSVVEVTPYLERAVDYAVDLNIRAIKRFEEAGFSREEAISMTRSMKHDIVNLKHRSSK